LTDATQTETITPATASKYAFTTSALSGPASNKASLGFVTVQEQDTFGNPTTTAETVSLSSNSSGTYIFNTTQNATTPTGSTTVSIASGQSSATFYYGDTKSGGPVITAHTTGLTDATQTETISGSGPASLVLANCVVQGTSQACSGTYHLGNGGTMVADVQVLDQFGNAATIGTSISLSVASGNTSNYSIASGATLTIDGSATPPNQSTTTFTVQKSGNASNSTTITVHVTSGPSVPDLTFTVQK
jgi:hypothetical protein